MKPRLITDTLFSKTTIKLSFLLVNTWVLFFFFWRSKNTIVVAGSSPPSHTGEVKLKLFA